MPKYAAETEVPADRSRSEIERTLQRYGAKAFMYGWQDNRAVIGFDLGGRRYRIVLPLPDPADPEFQLTPGKRQKRSEEAARSAWEQATRQRWRALALYIKAVLEAAETGITSLEIALQPYALLPDGRTVGEYMHRQIEHAYLTGRMPPLLPGLPEPSGGE